MATSTTTRPLLLRRSKPGRVIAVVIAAAFGMAQWFDAAPAFGQAAPQLTFPKRPKTGGKSRSATSLLQPQKQKKSDEQMLVQADEIQYDYNNERVLAVGNVQIYYSGTTIEADKVIYDQKTKRLRAEGNVRMREPDGRITYGEIIDLTDDYRDGFVNSLRVETADQTHLAARRSVRTGGNYTVFESGVYTACAPCKDNPKKPPLWQIRAARIIHNQEQKVVYFEDARLEFFGLPIAYLPYFSAPDPTVKRKSGVLMPSFSSSTKYGFAVEVPIYWALAPDYDFTLTPKITTKQGPLLEAEWRQRLVNGSYTIRAAGIFQLDKDVFLRDGQPPTPGYRDWRGSIETSGRFNITDKWSWGWDGTLLSDRTFWQDYSLGKFAIKNDPLRTNPTEAVSQIFIVGRGERSYFDARMISYYGLSEFDVQSEIPLIHPVVDYAYVFKQPVFGGELGYNINFTSLSRQDASFNPITPTAAINGTCGPQTADPAVKNPSNCLLRGIPGSYTRLSAEANWRTSIIDSYGQVFTPFLQVRGAVANVNINSQAGVSNFITPGDHNVARFMPTAGLEYRYPFISVHSWGTQTIEPIAQIIVRPNETAIGSLPNEDAQSLVFDATNLFQVSKFSGWDRVEGGGRANLGVKYTAQFNQGGFFNFLFGQSYQLFGLNSYTVGGTTNTGLDSGLDTARSDYVAMASFQPNSTYAVTARFRLDERTADVRRFELETNANYDRWNFSLLYGNYDAQPALGFLERRQGILGSSSVKINANWALLGAARYNISDRQFDQSRIGVGYIDDCLILALNYITNYTYSGNAETDHRVLLQLSLRTLGGTSVSQGVTGFAGGN